MRDTDAACVATGLSLCLKEENIAFGSKSGTNEDRTTHTKISWRANFQSGLRYGSMF